MHIDNTGPLRGIRGTKPRAKTGKSENDFSLPQDSSEPENNAAAPVASVGNLDALLALQSIEDSTNAPRQTAERGFDLLDRLEEMRLGLLTGRLSVIQVNRIAQKVRNLGRTGDDKLDSILSDIDMRARVELAKLGVFDL